jgi:MFS family permease
MQENLLIVPKRYHWPFLSAFGFALLLATMQTGYSLGGSSFAQSIFQAQTSNWTTGDQTMITSSSTLGLAIGSLFSGPLLGKGRRKTVLIGNVIILFSYALQLEIKVYLLALGKLLQGAGSGMILSAASIMIPETVPTKLVGGFGSLVNLGVVLGLSAYMFLGLLVPKDPVAL